MSDIKLFIPLLDNGQGDIKADFLRSFFVGFAGRSICLVRISDSHPGRARNRAAAEFLRSDCTHVQFIDGDIDFTPAHVARMFENTAPIVGGVYCLKDAHQTRLCLQTIPDHQPCEASGLLPVARIGTGFLRIAREVLEAMKMPDEGSLSDSWKYAARYSNHGRDEWDYFSSGVIGGEWLSEDWYFCDRARALGFEVQADFEIQLLHEGAVKFPLHREPERLELCPAVMKPHIERIWRGEYAIPLDPPPATVLDIGANIGGFTEWACEQWPAASIVAYEPHPHNATLFRLNTQHRASRIDFHQVGVRTDADPSMLAEGTNCGEHSFHFHGQGPIVGCIAAKDLASAEFVKIDTEGSELEILGGLDLTKTRAIALEYHSADDLRGIRFLLSVAGFVELKHEEIEQGRGVLKFSKV